MFNHLSSCETGRSRSIRVCTGWFETSHGCQKQIRTTFPDSAAHRPACQHESPGYPVICGWRSAHQALGEDLTGYDTSGECGARRQ